MRISTFGHCCLLIEEKGKRILTDPGVYSSGQNDVRDIDCIVITHDHADHVHTESLKEIMRYNPQAKIVTNTSVGEMLTREGIDFVLVEDGQSHKVGEVSIRGVGNDHALIYAPIPVSQNTGYFIADKLFYPGDALTVPKRPVDILALPVAGPWLRISDSIEYALKVKPRMCFPVHDGMLKKPGLAHTLPKRILEENGIRFVEPPLQEV